MSDHPTRACVPGGRCTTRAPGVSLNNKLVCVACLPRPDMISRRQRHACTHRQLQTASSIKERCVCAPSTSVSACSGPACSAPAPLAAPCASATQRGVIKDAPAHTANYKLRPQSKTVCVCSVNVRVRLLWTCLLGSCPPRRPLCLSHATWRHCFTAGVEFRMSLLGPLCACAPTHHMTRSR